jgi:hypothetical protein
MPAAPIHRPLSEPQGRMWGHDVPVDDRRTLRAGVIIYHAKSKPDELVLAMGTGIGKGWREDPAEGLVLPATVLRPLRQLLEALELKAAWEDQ